MAEQPAVPGHLTVHTEPVQAARRLDRDGPGTPVGAVREVGGYHQGCKAAAQAKPVDQPLEQRRVGPAIAERHGRDAPRRGAAPGFEPGRVVVAPGRALGAQEAAERAALGDHLGAQGIGRGQLLPLRLDHECHLQGEAAPRK